MDISAISFHKVIQTCRKFDAIEEWGSVVALTYIAAQRTLYGYNDMADAKAMLESIARSFGYIYGREKNIRINTVSQSPTPTTAGSGVMGLENLMDFAERMSPLGNATAAECADYIITPLLRPHAESHHAEPLPRRRILQHGHEHAGDAHLQRGSRIPRRQERQVAPPQQIEDARHKRMGERFRPPP